MLAYHSNAKVKAVILKQLRAHAAADEIVKGQYWQNGKGCAVGCTIHSGNHVEYEARFGIPQMLAAYVLDERWPETGWIPLAVFAVIAAIGCILLGHFAQQMSSSGTVRALSKPLSGALIVSAVMPAIQHENEREGYLAAWLKMSYKLIKLMGHAT